MKGPVTLIPILNRTEGDPWYHLVPVGDHPHAPSGTVQILDAKAITAIANRFAAEAARPEFAGILIDQEHFSYDADKTSEAFGWIKEVQARDSGLWGRVEWTDLGRSALANKRYKFISPVWLPRDVERLGNQGIRPLRLDSAGLTNNPNLRGMVPLVNRAGEEPANSPKANHMKSVATALGLAPEASEEAILGALTALRNRAESAERELTPTKNRAEKAEGDLKTLRESTAASDLEPFKNRIAEGTEAFWREMLIANRPMALANLGKLPDPATKTGAVLNRATAKPPAAAADAGKTGEEDPAIAARIANRAAEIGKTQPGLTHSQCWSRAKAEITAV